MVFQLIVVEMLINQNTSIQLIEIEIEVESIIEITLVLTVVMSLE